MSKKAKKGFLRLIFSRITILLVLMLIQIGMLFSTLTYLSEYATYIYAALTLLEIGSVIYIINSKTNPDFMITWILLIFVLPVFGTIFYVFTRLMPGTGYIKRRLCIKRSAINGV